MSNIKVTHKTNSKARTMARKPKRVMSEHEMEWNNYLSYLNDWTKDHSSPLFYGMTPASFDEWCDNEYS